MRVLIVAPFVPYEGIPHAGGLYLQRHVAIVAESADVRIVAPATAENQAASSVSEWPVTLVRHSVLGRPALRLLRRGLNFFGIAVPPVQYWGELRRAIRDAAPFDVLELQWQEYAVLAREGRRTCPEAVVVGVVHDVLSQKLERDRRYSSSRIERLRAVLAAALTRTVERVTITALDRVVVFSEKDARLLHDVSASIDPVVLPPPLARRVAPAVEDAAGPRPPRVLFVGAMNRQPNIDGARWLLEAVWPAVRAEVADAELVVAGGGMSASLAEHASAEPGVSVTGYVDDLDATYRAASVVVVPLLSGAGLKFKVAEAMLAGRAVVSTTVGAEGYPVDEGIFWAVADDAGTFAREVVQALRRPGDADELGARARTFAEQRFDAAAYGRAVQRVYGQRGAVPAADHDVTGPPHPEGGPR